jgi:ferredoxin hydrogenase large subunit/hydrogenase large subunit
MAYGITPSPNGRRLQNLILAADYLHSHVLHFYQLAALDFVDVKAVLGYTGASATLRHLRSWVEKALDRKDAFPAAPFLPRYEAQDYLADAEANVALLAHYAEALEIRRVCHEMGAVFGARLPHSTAIVPGGCTETPTIDRVLLYTSRLKRVAAFLQNVYLPDLLAVAKAFPGYFEIGRGPGNFLCYGVFENDEAGNRFLRPGVLLDGRWEALDAERIAEEVASSRFSSASGLHPSAGETVPAASKPGAYSWIKSPRYGEKVVEVGALARVLTNYHCAETPWVKQEVDAALAPLGLTPDKLPSVLGRHLARGLESLWLARQAFRWLDELELGGPPSRDFTIPSTAAGYGLTEAPRGALGHWLAIKDYRIERYQCIVPTTWNCSPRDDRGQPGPVEQALAGTKINQRLQPIEVGRIVRSFDPCIACAVH